jgi:hypothetical protein
MSDVPDRVEDPKADSGKKDDAERTAETLLHGKVQEEEGGDDNFRFYQAEGKEGGNDNFRFYEQEGQGPSALQREAYDPDLAAKDRGDRGQTRPQERVEQGDIVIENNITVITEGPLAGCMALVRPDGRVEYYRGEQLRFDRHNPGCSPQHEAPRYHDQGYEQHEQPYWRQPRERQGRQNFVPSSQMDYSRGRGRDVPYMPTSGGRVYQEDRGSSREGGIRTPNYDSQRRSDDYGHVYEGEGYGQGGGGGRYGSPDYRGVGTPPIVDDRGSPERRDVPNREYNLEVFDRVLGGVDILGQHGVFGRNRGRSGRDDGRGRGYDPRDADRGRRGGGGDQYWRQPRQRQGRIDYSRR